MIFVLQSHQLLIRGFENSPRVLSLFQIGGGGEIREYREKCSGSTGDNFKNVLFISI